MMVHLTTRVPELQFFFLIQISKYPRGYHNNGLNLVNKRSAAKVSGSHSINAS